MKRIIRLGAAVLVLALICAVFVACTPRKSGEGRVYYLNFKPEQAEEWEELAKAYEKETGVEVTVVTAASDEYETTLKSEMAKSEAPTLFQVNGPVGLSTWRDYCYDLKDTAVYKNLKSDDFALFSEGGEVLGVAYVIETYGIICNKTILEEYCKTEGAVISSPYEITNFETLRAVAEDIGAKKEELGVQGAFTSSGMDASSDWRFKTHLLNVPLYYEYRDRGITEAAEVEGTYLDNYKQVWDMYIDNATCPRQMISSKTAEDATSEFALGEAVFYQNGTWAYKDIVEEGFLEDKDLFMIPIYIGVEGEENQGLCTGSENYWCINKNASQEDIKATADFLEWVITSDKGRESLAKEMNFTTPFTTFTEEYKAHNPLVDLADDYIEAGKTPVSWNFSTIPSENFKNGVGSALLEYAQGTGSWDALREAFIEGWKREYNAVKNNS